MVLGLCCNAKTVRSGELKRKSPLSMAPHVDIKYTQCFINNEFVDAISGKTFTTVNPSTEEKIAEIASADKADVDRAVEAAHAAFARGSPWRTMDASSRGKLLNLYADLLEKELDTLSILESLDNGKPISMAKFEMGHVVSVFRYYAGWADKIHGEIVPADGPLFCYTRKEPVGVVGQIIPWNVPMMMFSWKVAPALAAGCCCVVKPAEQTPLTALMAAELARQAGFPPGVLNVLPGFGETAGEAITHHSRIDKVSFTGSTEVGQLIMKACGESNVKNITLELGGKNPLIIFDDCDLDMASGLAYETLFANQGQICASPSRIFVHEKIHDDFVKKVVAMTKTRVVGDPFDPKTQQGPQIDNTQFRKVLDLIDSGKTEGARLEIGGRRHGSVGFFIEPTVFTGVKDHMRIAREEIFGPVMQILKFSSDEEVIRRANDTKYGLAAGIVTNNVNRVQKMIQALEAGTVWVNTFLVLSAQTTFGGCKMSGIGKDLGKDGLNSYLHTKMVIQGDPNKNS